MTLRNTPFKKSNVKIDYVDGQMENTGDVQILIQTVLECKDDYQNGSPNRYLLFHTQSGYTTIDTTQIVALTNRVTGYDIHMASGTIFTVGDVE